MSLGIVIKGPEGIVLAADTRLTLAHPDHAIVTYDNASKVLVLGENAAAVTYGVGSIGRRSAHSLMPEFRRLQYERMLNEAGPFLSTVGTEPNFSVSSWAIDLGQFFQKQWETAGSIPEQQAMAFLIAGVNEGAAYGEVYQIGGIGSSPVQLHPDSFGMMWGGQTDLASRIIIGYDGNLVQSLDTIPGVEASEVLRSYSEKYQLPVPYAVLPLQDCIDLAIFLIRATITLQGLAWTSRGVGGTIEVVTITPEEGVQWVQKREIRGEL